MTLFKQIPNPLCSGLPLFGAALFMALPSSATAADSGSTASPNIIVHGKNSDTGQARSMTDPSVPAYVPSISTPGGVPSSPSTQTASSTTPQPYLFSMHTPPVLSAGKYLSQNGIYITGWNVSEYSGVPAGGIKHGSFFNNFAGVGLDLDMQRLAHIPGAKIHFLADDVAGQGRAGGNTGSSWGFVSYYGNHIGFQVREFTWDQALFNNRLFILAGRSMPKGGEFDGSELYCMFPSFLCSVPTTFTVNGSMPSFVTSSWGARFLYKPTAKTYIKTGIWEAEPWLKTRTHNGWPGPDWGFDKAQGEYIPTEAGYRTNFTNDLYPRAYDLGFVYDTANYSDPLYNNHGQSRPLYGGTPMNRRGRTQLYLQAQQMIWKPDKHGTRGLILFGAANLMTSGNAAIRDGFVAGLFDWGPFASRPRDYFGLVGQSFIWDHRFIEGMNDTLTAHGHQARWAKQETMVEVNYGLNIAPGVICAPYFEYIWNPDQLGRRTILPNLNTAVQAGVMLNVQFSPAFGLPTLHRTRN